ncbi:MAG TPA: hypothetical protein PKY99_00165 [Turneriella sp.]|nr:hypothetical protein [Turneriella sp.]
MRLETEDFYNLYEGGNRVHDTHRYLRKLFNEDDEAYQKRLNWASYPNYQRKIVNTYVGYVFHGKITVEPAGPLDLEKIARKACMHALIGGASYIFEADQKIRVFSRMQVAEDDDARVFTISAKNGKWVINTRDMTVTAPDKSGVIVTEPLADGRFQRCIWNDDGQSLIADTARMNLQLYNMKSQLDTHFDRSLFFFLYGPTLGKDKKFTPGQYVPVNPGETMPGIVQVDSTAARSMREEMQILKREMAITVALEQEFADEVKVESGTALAVKKLDTNAIINSVAYAVQGSVNKVAAHYAAQYKTEPQTIKLDPFLKVREPRDEQEKYKRLIDIAGTDLITKQIQKNAVMHALAAEVKPEVLDSLLKDIDKNGGRKVFESSPMLNLQ